MKKNNAYFKPVDLKINFADAERELLDRWEKKGIPDLYLKKNKKSNKYFSFLDGPITANNPMGVHHAWGRTYKDIFQRFKNMQGFKQRFQNGFDAQGLWVEVEVEKELGFKNKKDIETFGVDKFVQLCKDRVRKYSDIQTLQSKRLAYFMDWKNSYFTLSDDNNYMIWRFLKIVNENGWLYKGNDSVPWCPRCETAISQHEMLTEDYKEITHESVYLAFPVVNEENEYLLVWTTTPWTIPANISIAIDQNLIYAKVEMNAKYYWLAKDAIERVLGGNRNKILKEVPGSKLVGYKYHGAFDDLPKVADIGKKYEDNFHRVIATDSQILPVTTTEGTGLVHTAVSAGTEDFRLGQKLGLPMIPVIEDDASYMKDLGFLSGLNAKKNPRIILDHLEKLDREGKHFYLKIEKYTHRYPACWRCKTELVWKVTDEWYIAMDKAPEFPKSNSQFRESGEGKSTDLRTLRQRMTDVTGKIKWIPEFGLDRELDWLANMHDWLISKKNRYWGLALPIWECTGCGNFEVIGSAQELKERAVEGYDKFEGKSPHKPQIDNVKIKCSKCASIVSRIEPVGNPWLDAGIVAYSTVSENNKACNIDKSDTQPLYLTNKSKWQKWIPADFITESFPGQFKNWFYSLIAMSTVMENKEPFKTVLGFGTLFGEDGRPMHKSWGNSIEFNEGADKIGVDVMRWMYAKQNPVDNMLFGYKIADEVRRKFHLTLWNIYNFFITYSNLDGWKPKTIRSLKSVNLLDVWLIARLRETISGVTASLNNYDTRSAADLIEAFVGDMSLWYVRRSRERVDLSAEDKTDKDDFYSVSYFVLSNLCRLIAPFTPFISDIMFTNLSKADSVHLASWPDLKQADKLLTLYGKEDDINALIAQMKVVRNIAEKGHSLRKEINIPVKQPLRSVTIYLSGKISADLEKLIKSELNVKEVIWMKGAGDLKVKFDTKITLDLKEEMMARELIRKIQEERKLMGLNLAQKVSVQNEWLPTNSKLLQWVSKKAQVSNITIGIFKVTE